MTETVEVPVIKVDPNKHIFYQTIANTVVSVTVIISATVLDALGNLAPEAWTGAIGAALAISGGVTVLQGKRTNGK